MTQAIDGYDSEYMAVALVDLIHKALRNYKQSQIKKISYDGDGKSCELIVTLAIGDIIGDFVLSSQVIKELT
jgi:hypothetical protein